MPDTLSNITAGLARDMAIVSIGAVIVDVPTVRRHKLSHTAVTAQNYVIVRLRLANGVEGIGEAATLGGPRWAEESVRGDQSKYRRLSGAGAAGPARGYVRGRRRGHGGCGEA